MILMQAPAPDMTFGGAPSGAAYVSDQYSLVRIMNDAPADQIFLQTAGCYTLSPFGGWGTFSFNLLSDLYAADGASGLVLPGLTGFPAHTTSQVLADPTTSNNGTWYKTGTGNGAGNWTFTSATVTSGAAGAAAAALVATGAAATAQQAATSTAADRVQTDADVVSANTASNGAITAAGIKNVLSAATSAGGALPFEVTGISGGIGTGSGGTAGTYAGGASGGPPGFQWQYTIDGTGKLASYQILTPGLATTNAVPTLSLPSGGLTGAAVPTAAVSTIPAGRQFYAPSSDGAQLLAWGNNAGTLASAPFGATQLATPTFAAVRPLIAATFTSGTYPSVDGASNLTAGLTIFAPDQTTSSGPLQGVSVYSGVAGAALLVAEADNGDGTTSVIATQAVTLVVGVNTFTSWNPFVPAGTWVGTYNSTGAQRYSTGQTGKTLTYHTGAPGTSIAKTTISNALPTVSYTQMTGEVVRAKGAESALQAQFDGSTTTGGQATPAALTSALSAGFAGVCMTPITAGSISAVGWLTASTDAVAYLVTLDALKNIQSIVKTIPFAGKQGANSVYIGPQAAGLYVVIWPKTASLTFVSTGTAGMLGYVAGGGAPVASIYRSGTTTVGSRVITGLSTTADLAVGKSVSATGIPANSSIASIDSATQITFTNSSVAGATIAGTPMIAFGGNVANAAGLVSVGWVSVAGTSPRLNALEATVQGSSLGAAGYGLMAAADNTGVTDATAILAAARSTHPNPNIPPGTFSVTSWPYYGEGPWGPGVLKVGGITVSLPIAPERGSRYLKMRAYLMSQLLSGACLIVPGDSITAGAFATSMATHYLTMLLRFANLGIAVDECVTGNFDNADPAANLAFQGISLANPTTGTLGPNGAVKSLMLQPGQSINVSGAYERVDATYTGVSGGTLVFAYNGTAYKTVTCATSGSDVLAGGGATGQTANGAYSITNTGSVAVEITSLMRFGVKVANSPPRLNVCRFAHGDYKFTTYSSSNVASMVRIANAVSSITGSGANHLLMPLLGTNDGIANNPPNNYATMKAAVTAFTQSWITAGIPASSIIPIMPWKFQASDYQTNGYEIELAGVRDGYKAAGVSRCVQTDGYDFIGEGLSGSDGHPLDAGELAIFNACVTSLAAAVL